MKKAVVDRIVDGKHAVLLVGEDEKELIIPVTQLPEGAKEGVWLKVSVNDDGSLSGIDIDQEETDETKERIKSKMELLRQRSKRKNL